MLGSVPDRIAFAVSVPIDTGGCTENCDVAWGPKM